MTSLHSIHTDSGTSPTPTYEELRNKTAAEIRSYIRSGAYGGHTAGLAPHTLQGNLVILPETYALDFFRFCQRNPKPCPLIGVSDTGDPMLHTLGTDIDIRTDVPEYNIYQNGTLTSTVCSLTDMWQDDMVAFVLGCSFSFEEALIASGIDLPHIRCNTTVPMYKTNIQTTPAGPFKGPLVVSMRPMTPLDAIKASAITTRYDAAHGTPVHLGSPEQIGIHDIMAPDWGEPVEIKPGQTPVFWACGVTPQAAMDAAKLPLCITHAPGRMLITDLPA